MNEYVGYSEPDKQYNAELFFFSLFFIYVSFIHFFRLKESTTMTTDKQGAKRIQQKIYRNVEDKSLPIVSD